MWIRCLAAGLVMAGAVTAVADVPPPEKIEPPPPPPPRRVDVPVDVRYDAKSKNYRIVIPKRLLRTVVQVGQVDERPQGSRSLVAALALSAALASVVIMRRRSWGAKAATATGVVALSLAASPWAVANLAPPDQPVPVEVPMITIQASDGNTVQLYLPGGDGVLGGALRIFPGGIGSPPGSAPNAGSPPPTGSAPDGAAPNRYR